jgi:hypothetical protein
METDGHDLALKDGDGVLFFETLLLCVCVRLIGRLSGEDAIQLSELSLT